MYPSAHTPAREAEEARPWNEASGVRRPEVHVYERGHRPALWAYVAGRWRLGWVEARHDWADRSVVYQVEIVLPRPDGELFTSSRLYRWPQEGLAAA